MTAIGRPTPRLRVAGDILQQKYSVTFDAGTVKESTQSVWLDVAKVQKMGHASVRETADEKKARIRVQALGDEFHIQD